MKYICIFIIFFSTLLFSQTRELIPLSKTEFTYINKKGTEQEIDLTGKDFILVSVREEDSDGRFYAVNKDGTVWLSGGISSGEEVEFTPSGKWKVLRKERFYASKAYPEEDGSNNFVNVEKGRLEHLKNGGVLACGEEDKTEIIDEGYRISLSGLALLSKTGKKWSIKKCTPFSAIDTQSSIVTKDTSLFVY